jgi:hypothetical protein
MRNISCPMEIAAAREEGLPIRGPKSMGRGPLLLLWNPRPLPLDEGAFPASLQSIDGACQAFSRPIEPAHSAPTDSSRILARFM